MKVPGFDNNVVKEYAEFQQDYDKSSLLRRFEKNHPKVSRLLHPPSLNLYRQPQEQFISKYIINSPEDCLILNLGSGTESRFQKKNIVNLDIFPHDNANIVGDGQFLPFSSETFDVVLLNAVIYYIPKPWLAAEEIYRVLKDKGKVIVTSPFLYHIHDVNDFYRFTDDGLRQLFSSFNEVICCVNRLPSATVISVLSAYFSLFCLNRRVAPVVRLIICYIAYPLKIMDWMLAKNKDSRILAGSFLYVGEKP